MASLTPDAGSMVVGDLWAGITGNVMVVQRIEGDRVLLGYVDDPEDNSWQWSEDVRSTLEYRGRTTT